ncbi:MAG: RNA polymerase sigma factor [Vicinamibacterales bacterium]|jgi:RNA polymerase sigma-70 factor (ECF subfamily)|nr:RNA polymerase sigma factor [Vicinamibacterales bacterium]
MSDLAQARRLIAGDEAAFEEFFSGYFPRLYRFACARVGGNEDVAEEITQTTLIRAITKLHTYRGEAALFTWLCTLCRREIAGWRSRTGRVLEVPLAEDHPPTRAALEALATFGGDPEDELRRRELTELVRATLDHLPGRWGDALEWRYIEGLSVSEIAARLSVSYKAAESLLSRARRAFRDGFALVADSATAVASRESG